MKTKILVSLLLSVYGFSALAQEAPVVSCAASDKICILSEIKATIVEIDNQSWKDKAYRELAKSYTYEGMEDDAIALIPLITSPDTKAMTVRGIGFAAADSNWEKARYDALWESLHQAAIDITDPPSQGIALTYIAMAQAFAKDDVAATKTALAMENDALRHKALGESAEIQAERGDFTAAAVSIEYIDSLPFRNKAYATISRIFVSQNMMQEAYDAAQKISDNPTLKTEALQRIVNSGNPEEEMLKSKKAE